MQTVNLILTPKQAADMDYIRKAASRVLSLTTNHYQIRIIRRSIDARQREPKILLTVEILQQTDESSNLQILKSSNPHYRKLAADAKTVIIVGAGPAGLFAALQLIEEGVKPIIIERGKPVSDRKIDVAQLNRNNGLNTESNYCFGEGGAGTFSDGKLYSRSNKRGNIQRVMEIFHYHGADDSILYEAHPHIGSDRLPQVVKNMRQTILDCGGEIYFQHRVDGLIIEDSTAKGCRITPLNPQLSTTLNNSQLSTTLNSQLSTLNLYADAVILAIGHSAHDTYRMLAHDGVKLEAKNFALGVRVEHPQELIDRLMYHGYPRGEYLPAATYSLVTQVDGRGVYSFCMCPGGHIVPASSQKESCVVNGMSSSKRNSPYANSGIVVEVHIEDLPPQYQDPLGVLRFQEEIEHEAWHQIFKSSNPQIFKSSNLQIFKSSNPQIFKSSNSQIFKSSNSQSAPAQRLRDFVEGKESKTLPPCSYLPGIVPSRLDLWLPDIIRKRLQQGFRDFDRKYKGFLTNEAVIVGVESRSSSPVRIPRDKETMQHVEIQGLYPCGEGAGYAGGITSSAMDGINVAQKIIEKNKK